MIKDKNFSNKTVPSIIDTEYRDCNFSHSNCLTVFGQKVGHRIFPDDDTPRTFIDCNMVNCEPPPNSNLIHCNTAIRENRVEVASEDLIIDGDTIQVEDYVNMIYGRYIGDVYVYQATPIQIPCPAPEVI